jgi:hypothetical protein
MKGPEALLRELNVIYYYRQGLDEAEVKRRVKRVRDFVKTRFPVDHVGEIDARPISEGFAQSDGDVDVKCGGAVILSIKYSTI